MDATARSSKRVMKLEYVIVGGAAGRPIHQRAAIATAAIVVTRARGQIQAAGVERQRVRRRRKSVIMRVPVGRAPPPGGGALPSMAS